MIYQVISDRPYEEVCSSVEDVCKKHGFGVMKVYDFTKILEEKGHPISKNVSTFEICQPQFAAELLENNPILANFMPCRLAIEDLGNGKTRIMTYLPTNIVNLCQLPTLYDAAEAIDVTIKKIMDELKG